MQKINQKVTERLWQMRCSTAFSLEQLQVINETRPKLQWLKVIWSTFLYSSVIKNASTGAYILGINTLTPCTASVFFYFSIFHVIEPYRRDWSKSLHRIYDGLDVQVSNNYYFSICISDSGTTLEQKVLAQSQQSTCRQL